MNMDFSQHMLQAIKLAEYGRFLVYPNPTVGAVLVKDGCVVAKGSHMEYGGPHAEVVCIENAKQNNIDTKECTLVVTLEPCHHQGKTPPCTEAIIQAGIKHVVIGTRDKNPVASGGIEFLQSKGVKITLGVEEQLCLDLIEDFTVHQEGLFPYVILKMASTLDGRIATRTGHSKWISCDESRLKNQELRANMAKCGGIIIVGGGTFREDNPRLTVHDAKEGSPQPLACVVTTRLPEVNLENYLLQHRAHQTIFYTTPAIAASPKAKALENLGVRVWSENSDSQSQNLPSLKALLLRLKSELKCSYVLCEGGGKLALSLLEQSLINEFHLHMAPTVIGDNEATPIFDGKSPLTMDEAIRLRIANYYMCCGDIHIIMRPK